MSHNGSRPTVKKLLLHCIDCKMTPFLNIYVGLVIQSSLNSAPRHSRNPMEERPRLRAPCNSMAQDSATGRSFELQSLATMNPKITYTSVMQTLFVEREYGAYPLLQFFEDVPPQLKQTGVPDDVWISFIQPLNSILWASGFGRVDLRSTLRQIFSCVTCYTVDMCLPNEFDHVSCWKC